MNRGQAVNDDSRFYKSLLDNLNDGVYFIDPARKITYWNRGAEAITGFAAPEVLGTSCADNILMHVDEQGRNMCKDDCCPAAATIRDGMPREADLFLHHKSGHRLPVRVRVSPIKNRQGDIIGAVELFSDNSSKVAAGERMKQLQEMALRDALTGIGNRRYAEMTITGRIDELKRYGWNFALLFIDIDNFKAVNDTWGHEAGDSVLKMVTRTLISNVRSFDAIARWGGEEIIVVLVNTTRQQMCDIAEKIRMLVEHSSLGSGEEIIRVTVSVGATLAQADDTPETVVSRADSLMYRSKKSGRNRVTAG